MLSDAVVRGLAPTHLENYRASRYRADDVAIELSRFGAADRALVVEIYEALRELLVVVDPLGGVDDAAPLLAFAERRDLRGLVFRVRHLGASAGDEATLAEAIHDIRGGGFTAMMLELGRLSRGPYRKNLARSLYYLARDHMKMMRNVVRDLDPIARERDLTFRPHSLGDLARALREFTATAAGDEPVVVDVQCTAEGIIAESCVECAAIDRVAYNLLNNAVRYADRPTVAAWLLTMDSDLRVAIANSISAEQRGIIEEQLATGAASLFGSFTTSGSGYGLRIVSELVGRAYGVASVETLTKEGYVGAKVVDGNFVSWFHWPLGGA